MAGLRQLDNYVLASIQEPVKVLGLKLKPICLGHIFLMKRFNNPFASDDPDQYGSAFDLMQAVLICSMSYDDYLHFRFNCSYKADHLWQYPSKYIQRILTKLTGKSYAIRQYLKWDKRLQMAFSPFRFPSLSNHRNKHVAKVFRRFTQIPKLDAFEELGKFNQYRRSPNEFVPLVTRESSGTKATGAHWSMNIYNTLLAHYEKDTLLNMPLAQAIVEYYKTLEDLGCVTFFDDFQCAVESGEVKQ